ncbi:hypothetical protein GH714_005007 [Hevea brasiliensis]|uniref:Leucine-rich repeat-containing N-terminal plant-type domain-containing protein n=1 Tax=Hevea brasiliensis TaxID=3981 RepID=A0A6A6KJB4_HEVBR|nr:hypothetical protein GH714_005007 [Hevea brasiliensis]
MELSGLESWNSTSDCCHWERVRCHNSQKVTSLDLFHLTPSLAMKTLVKSDVLAPLFHLQTLIFLDISYNGHIQGALPETIGEASRMKILILSSNRFFGTVPPSISKLGLRLLDLSCNKFSGNEFPIFNPNSSLAYIDFSFNKLSGEVPVTFPLVVKVLLLNENEFSGVLPQEIAKFSQLQYLNLQSNNIGGMINNHDVPAKPFGQIPFPSSIAMARHVNWTSFWDGKVHILHNLEVFWKKFEQGLPIQNIQIYTFLDLSNNQLSGEIPDSLGRLKSLKSLNLSNNNFFGGIPWSFGGLQRIESLDLSHNNFSGEIPHTFGNLLQLSNLDLSNNKLEGCIPGGPQMDRMNDPNSYANNSGLRGMQIKVPCEEIPSKPKQVKEKMVKKSKSSRHGFPGKWQ